MISDAEDPIGSLGISLGKRLFRSSAQFKLLGFIILGCMCFLYILNISPLLDIQFFKYLLYSKGCLSFC